MRASFGLLCTSLSLTTLANRCRPPEIKAREVHVLRDGPGGAKARDRASDGAKAWRCSLQGGTASARRLHWWDVPGREGRVIEFASGGVHDDLAIPE